MAAVEHLCVGCGARVGDGSPAALTLHANDAALHAGLAVPAGMVYPTVADWIIGESTIVNAVVAAAAAPVVVGATGLLGRLGINSANFKSTMPSSKSMGGAASPTELAILFEVAGTIAKSTLDANSFWMSLLFFFVNNDASDELDKAGALVVRTSLGSDADVNLHQLLLSTNMHPRMGRLMTMRRVAHGLGGPQGLWNEYLQSDQHQVLVITGTPLSRKRAVPNKHYLVPLSFYSAIKDPADWTDEERDIVYKHADTVTKIAKTSTTRRYVPLMVDPDGSTTMHVADLSRLRGSTSGIDWMSKLEKARSRFRSEEEEE